MIAWWINLHVWVRLANETIFSADEKRKEKKRMLRSEDVLNAGLLLLFSCWVVFDSLQPHELQHTRPPCTSPSPEVCPSSCPLHQWCHPASSSSDSFFSFCPQSFPASGTFSISQLFTSDDQNTGVSASTSVLLSSIQGWSPLRSTGLISLLSKGHSGAFSSTTVKRHQFFGALPSLWCSSHNHTWPLGRP